MRVLPAVICNNDNSIMYIRLLLLLPRESEEESLSSSSYPT